MAEPFAHRAVAVLRHAGARHANRGLGGGEAARDVTDLLERNPAAQGKVVERRARRDLANRVDADRFRTILRVLPAMLEHLLDDGEQQRPVLARLDHDMGIGLAGARRRAGIDHDQVGAFRLRREHTVPAVRHDVQPDHVADRWVHADEQEALGVVDVRDQHGHVRAVHLAHHQLVVVGIHRADIEGVGAAKTFHEAVLRQGAGLVVSAGIAEVGGDRMRSVPVADRLELSGDVGDRFLVARLHVTLANALHRLEQSTGMIAQVLRRPTLGAEVAPAVGMRPVRQDAMHLLAVGGDLQPADRQADAAEGLDRFQLAGRRLRQAHRGSPPATPRYSGCVMTCTTAAGSTLSSQPSWQDLRCCRPLQPSPASRHGDSARGPGRVLRQSRIRGPSASAPA